ncbi:unnamed protein product [Anisakis simplex]|uniref:ABC transporter domain-containing protein n=1 Tax=Anisakis simplex TaxID=6269 RepID=A0A0M3JX71_ANISI|nr:unnamed protein product [Anisakis simplex]
MLSIETSRFSLPPVEPIFLTWQNLRVVTKRGNRLLLDNVMGVAQPGQLIALMGASGAGKTTLLNALLQRNIKGLDIEGTILVNGQEIGRKITKVMTELDLKNCESSRIGVEGIKKGITSGEAKRLSFATEILTNPSLLFADEPTTGIDSYMAFQVVKVLERLACECRKTIICTIHQPSSEVFEMFDRVVFLANGGVAFLGSPAEAVQFFGECGHPVPEHTNPAEFFIQTLAIVPGDEDRCIQRADGLKAAFLVSKFAKKVQLQCELSNQEAAVELVERGKASLLMLTMTLFMRALLDNWRNPSLVRAKMIQKCVMGIFLGFLYFQTDMTQDGVINIKGALFYYISELTYSTLFGIQSFMPGDFPLLVREYHDGIYPVACYYIAKVFSYLPIFTVDGMIMVIVSYCLIGLSTKIGTFLITLMVCVLVEWSAASVGIMISSVSYSITCVCTCISISVSPSYAVAVSLSGPLLAVFSITGGLYTNIRMIPEWIRWIQYFSWFRFGYESLITNEFQRFTNITCLLDSGKIAKLGVGFMSAKYLVVEGLVPQNSNQVLQITIINRVEILEFFERIADYCDKGVNDIPLTFLLGFFVSIVIQRWNDAFKNMGYLSNQAIHISNFILGDDDDSRLIRRTVARYLCLAQVIVFRDLSIRVRKRFPTMESIVKAGMCFIVSFPSDLSKRLLTTPVVFLACFMMEHEKAKFDSYKCDYDKYWVPINWAFALVIRARKDDKILADTYAVKICDEIRAYRDSLQMLCNYDWVEIPLVYPQVVFLSVHTYFFVCLIGRQFIIGVDAPNHSQIDIIFPIMTMLQYLFFVGWMKVAESLLNPFGEDDDDFECNFLIDRNFATSLCIVDEAHDDVPPLEKDLFWSSGDIEPLYLKDSNPAPVNPMIGSAARAAGYCLLYLLTCIFIHSFTH